MNFFILGTIKAVSRGNSKVRATTRRMNKGWGVLRLQGSLVKGGTPTIGVSRQRFNRFLKIFFENEKYGNGNKHQNYLSIFKNYVFNFYFVNRNEN